MATSTTSSTNSRRPPSGRTHALRNASFQKRLPVSPDDAYTYALRAAYLAYLLLPRQKRIQHVANTSKPIQRSTTSINDMVKDLNVMRDSKSTRFPHGFMAELDKRITGVLMGKERMPEFNDALVKRTFATFLNEFKNPTFRKSMETDRRVEDLLLIFFSKATSELQKGKPAGDDNWKLMVDRHVALFVRLISSTLANNDWSRERPELASRLKTLETKLLQHDSDLVQTAGSGRQSVEVEVPRSYEVRDMPLVVRVCSIFAKPTAQAQSDINAHRDEWTERAALKDLKDYQNHLMLGDHATLSRSDFDSDEAFELWKKGEVSDLSQMVLAIVQSNPELARSSNIATGTELHKQDPPVDLRGLELTDDSAAASREGSIDANSAGYTFVPADTRAYWRAMLKAALAHDLQDEELIGASVVADSQTARVLSQQTNDLLNEIALRWRLPQSSRLILLLDVIGEKYQHQEIALEIVDTVYTNAKITPAEPKKLGGAHRMSQAIQVSLSDRAKWTTYDYALYRNVLSALHDACLRELFELFQHCYDAKPPSVGPVMYVLENHIYDESLFSKTSEDLDGFSAQLADTLRQKARDKYHEILSQNVPDNAAEWEFYHVMQLGQAVTAICAKIQKRYRKNPKVMGVDPLSILVEEVLPSFAEDSRELVSRSMQIAKESDREIPIQDGFELYRELVSIRQLHAQTLPDREFNFHIEGLLQDFVWRWIQATDAKMVDWIEGAVSQDSFQVRQDPQAGEQGLPPTDEERHSQSAVDVYRIFNQSIEQIVKLEWDDDLQYARFMTSMSKSVGRGVARYCELLEARFVKEMDRQTPEQEAAAHRTQRERWLAAAKDFYTTGGRGGEKIEPFQFWRESFVKVNDIEYATQQLDKVEGEINVDACADAINRLDPAAPANVRRGKDSKFVFTIKIIEAEDLKAGDINGLSDPYVVLGDEYQKRLAKTRTVYQSLNPRWDETVDIATTGPLNVIATVWDWDVLGDHDCLGRTSIKLDPSHFNDFLPREYWLDLDTQGRVLVRVSMEGERDDIIFHFGKAFRTLKRTERDMTRRITDKLSAYIQQCLSRRTLRALLSSNTLSGVAISSMRGYLSKVSGQVAGRPISMAAPSQVGPSGSVGGAVSSEQVSTALKPLLNYFDDNFAIMKQTLTDSAMILVMTRLWKEVLVTIEGLLVPPLSDKLSAQRPLEQREVDVVYRWLGTLFDFFHAVDESGEALGVPLDVLKSAKYHDLQNLNFFYFEPTDNLMRTSEAMATATAARQQEQAARLNRLAAPSASSQQQQGPASTVHRGKSVMMSRNLGTMRKAKDEKRREAQADPSDDMILRILRMRPEAERYLKDRSRQKERLAAAAAAEAIVRQSLQASRAATLLSNHANAGLQSSVGGRGRGAGARRWDTVRE